MQSINSTYTAPVPRTTPPKHLACSTVNSYIDCLQEGNPLALAALIEGIIIVSSLIVGITCMVRRSACCSERHMHRPISMQRIMDQDTELTIDQEIELATADPEID